MKPNEQRCVVVGGGPILVPEEIRTYLKSDDYFIFCDGGLAHRTALGVAADLAVGDFDSHDVPDDVPEVITLPREKDDTDTAFAIKEAMRRGFTEFLLLGVMGGRFDHTLGNVSLLLMLHEAGCHGLIVDDTADMEIVAQTPIQVPATYAYFSVMSCFGPLEGVTINGAKYNVHHTQITPAFNYALSNEVVGEAAEVVVGDGVGLLIRGLTVS